MISQLERARVYAILYARDSDRVGRKHLATITRIASSCIVSVATSRRAVMQLEQEGLLWRERLKYKNTVRDIWHLTEQGNREYESYRMYSLSDFDPRLMPERER